MGKNGPAVRARARCSLCRAVRRSGRGAVTSRPPSAATLRLSTLLTPAVPLDKGRRWITSLSLQPVCVCAFTI